MTLPRLHYLDHTSAYVYAKGHYCNFKTVAVDARQKPKMLAILYIYRFQIEMNACPLLLQFVP